MIYKKLSLAISAFAFLASIHSSEAVKIKRQCEKTFTERAKNRKGEVVYPERFPVPAEKRDWSVPFPEYNPPYYRDPGVAANTAPNGAGWAEPESKIHANYADQSFFSHYLAHSEDEIVPHNPCGRTGVVGQGLLGKWGKNWAADPIVTRHDPVTGKLMVLLIQRADTGEWAIPGGMVDPGETKLSQTAARELKEETGLDINMNDAKEIYEGLVDDPRNTDNAWMMTKAYHKHLDKRTSLLVHKTLLAAADKGEIKAIQWVPYDDPRIENLFAAHSSFIKAVFAEMHEKIVLPFNK